MELYVVSNIGPWILSSVGVPVNSSSPTLFAAGGVALPIVRTDDGGSTWYLIGDNAPGTSVHLLALPGDDLLIGSMFNGFDGPNPNTTSYVYYRTASGSNIPANLNNIPGPDEGKVTRGFGVTNRGLDLNDNHGRVYASMYAQYAIPANPYLEYFLGTSADYLNWEFTKLPYWSGCGPLSHVGDSLPCPGIRFHFFDDNTGVGLFGQHWQGDYSQPIPTDQGRIDFMYT